MNSWRAIAAQATHSGQHLHLKTSGVFSLGPMHLVKTVALASPHGTFLLRLLQCPLKAEPEHAATPMCKAISYYRVQVPVTKVSVAVRLQLAETGTPWLPTYLPLSQASENSLKMIFTGRVVVLMSILGAEMAVRMRGC
jgi:hypothetical protein